MQHPGVKIGKAVSFDMIMGWTRGAACIANVVLESDHSIALPAKDGISTFRVKLHGMR